jgi:alkanesulfonate monooxygenase SsuD/methylene tetrahydromethanopterin reductase-like flavin-dependent oxidoreductase (luciferase family)
MLEGYATISHLAAVTSRIRLGLLVTCPAYRSPGVLVKTASTVDVLAGGRTYFGLGAGWYEREATGLGVPLPAVAERFDLLEETLRVAHQMWAGDRSPFNGKHAVLAEPLNVPQPLSQPHPPILIGGEGERRTLRLVAQYADAWNVVAGPALALPEFGQLAMRGDRATYLANLSARLTHKLDTLRRHCDRVGRRFDDIEKTVVTYVRLGEDAMRSEEVIELCAMYRGLGFDHVILNIHDVDRMTPLEILGKDVVEPVKRL